MKYNFLCLMFLAFYACSGPDSILSGNDNSTNGKMSESQLNNYIATFKELRLKTPELLEKMNKKEENLNTDAAYSNFEQIVKAKGFTSVEEFEKLNVKVGLLFSLMEGQKANNEFKEYAKGGAKKDVDNAIAEIEKLLKDPNTTPEAKEELKKSLEELKKVKSTVPDYVEPSDAKPWAAEVVERFNRQSSWKISLEELNEVLKHEKEIREIYNDFPLPRMRNVEED